MTEEVKKKGKTIERVIVSEALREKLSKLTEQANSALHGIASVTKSDVLNMILAGHGGVLAQEEIEKLRAEHLDQVKLALWLANMAREAKQAGEAVSLRELLERYESALSPAKARAVKRARQKPQGDAGAEAPEIQSV